MIPKSLRPFVAKLFEATDDKTIRWESGADDAYFCTHKGLNLHISYLFDDNDGLSYYFFRIRGKDKDASFSVNSTEDDYFSLNNLYSSISVNASNLDEELKGFFD